MRDMTSSEKVFVIGPDQISALPPERFSVGTGEELRVVLVVLPGVSPVIPMTFDLVGEGASVRVSALYLAAGSGKVRFDVLMHHRAPHTTSTQLFNGIAGGEASTVFSGRIVIDEGTFGIDAGQENHNILVSDRARAESDPQLEIYADDVKCSHGATVGRLDEQEQFYMRSRGIPEDEARFLQLLSFASPVLQSLPDHCREAVSSRVSSAIRSLLAQ
jgi:Fe-S cluster assembly protein SufD